MALLDFECIFHRLGMHDICFTDKNNLYQKKNLAYAIFAHQVGTMYTITRSFLHFQKKLFDLYLLKNLKIFK